MTCCKNKSAFIRYQHNEHSKTFEKTYILCFYISKTIDNQYIGHSKKFEKTFILCFYILKTMGTQYINFCRRVLRNRRPRWSLVLVLYDRYT